MKITFFITDLRNGLVLALCDSPEEVVEGNNVKFCERELSAGYAFLVEIATLRVQTRGE
jgi:hypothetical protein